MAMFGYFATFYVVLLMLETWFAFRPYIVEQAQKRKDLLGTVLPRADARLVRLVRAMRCATTASGSSRWRSSAFPRAHGLHGYVGFVFGSLKSREWWSSDLMPVIFLFSAIISGVSLLIVLYVVSCKLRRIPVDLACLKGLAYTVWGFIMVTLLLEGAGVRQHRLQGPRGHRHDHGVRHGPAARSLLHPAVRHRRRCPILLLLAT